MVIKNNSSKILILFFITLFLPFAVGSYLNPENIKYFNNLVYIVSIIHLIFLFTLFKFANETKLKYFENLLNFLDAIDVKLYLFFLLLYTLITQSYYLQFETITWDVPTYLVASQALSDGNLPYVSQWETKGPLLMYIYYFVSYISNDSYIIFKILNDLVLYSISFILFKTVLLLKEKNSYAFITSLLFLTLFSDPEYTAEFSELYTLFLFAAAFYIYIKNLNLFLVGALISLASLVNQSAAILCLPFLIDLILSKNISKNNVFVIFSGLLLPQLVFQIMYLIKGDFFVYIMNYFYLPFGYTEYYTNSAFYELKVWFKEYYYFNNFLYFSLISLFILEVFKVKNFVTSFNKNRILYLSLFTGFLIYYLGNTSYGHHLFYFVYFSSLLLIKIDKKEIFIFVSCLTIFASTSVIIKSFETSVYNLSNLNTVENEYPLLQLSEEIKELTNVESRVLALDSVLLLYYLDKPNYSYIIHPTNHFFDFITEPLVKLGKISTNEVEYLISTEPEVIICSPRRAGQKGTVIENTNFDCSSNNISDQYLELNVDKYITNRNIAYFYDPYKSFKVFIKNQ